MSDNKLAMPFLGLWLGVEHLQDIKIANSIKEFNNYNGYKVIITGENDHYTEYIREKHLNINKKICAMILFKVQTILFHLCNTTTT